MPGSLDVTASDESPQMSYFTGPGPDARYLQLLQQGRFCLQRCGGCDQAVFYPRSLCPHCGSPQLEFVPANGLGEVYSTTVQRRRPADGGDINIAIITLSEGPRMMSRVVGIPPEDVRIGQAVRAEVNCGDGDPIVVFKPLGDPT
jgi:uncharacterized protein